MTKVEKICEKVSSFRLERRNEAVTDNECDVGEDELR